MSLDLGRQFLTAPELFPEDISGESCGVESASIDFLGGPYLFSGCGAAEIKILKSLFGDICTTPNSIGNGEIEVSLLRVDAAIFREFSFQNWENTLDLDHTPEVISIAGLQFMARIELLPQFRAAIWLSGNTPVLDHLAIANFFRVLAAYRLNQLGGGLLHSAGLATNNEAYIFCGESGAGKTTLSNAALDAGMEILSDDLNAVYPDQDQWYAAKVPFAGSLNRNNASAQKYPLRFLGFLRQSSGRRSTLSLDTKPDAATIAELIAASPFLNIDPYRVDNVIDNLQLLVRDTETGVADVSLNDDVRNLFAEFSRGSNRDVA